MTAIFRVIPFRKGSVFDFLATRRVAPSKVAVAASGLVTHAVLCDVEVNTVSSHVQIGKLCTLIRT